MGMDGIEMTAAGNVARLRPVLRAVKGGSAEASADAEAPAASGLGEIVSLLAASSPPIDGTKVESLRQLIAQGQYPIDQNAIAEAMVAATFPGDGSADA